MYFVILNIFFRRLNSGTSNIIDTAKLQVKNVVLNQWKLITVLKSYVSKYTKDKSFENAINKEFLLFLQKIDPKVYASDFFKYFVSDNSITQQIKDNKETNSVLPNVLNGFKIKDKEVTEVIVPKWKATSKSVTSRVCIEEYVYNKIT